MEKTKKFLAGVAAVLIPLLLVGGIISAIVTSIPVKAWPVWYTLPALVAFAWKPIVYVVKSLIDYAKDTDEIYKGR